MALTLWGPPMPSDSEVGEKRFGVWHSGLTGSFYACWAKLIDPEHRTWEVYGKKHDVTDDVRLFLRQARLAERTDLSGDFGFDFEESVATVEGSNVANHMTRELLQALGEPLVARAVTPREVWLNLLQTVREMDRAL